MGAGIKESKSDVVFDIVNTTILVIILIAVLYPLIFVVSASFSDPMAVMKGEVRLLPKNPTLAAYKAVFKNKDIMTGYTNTILYTVVGTAVNLVMTIAGAYPLSRKDFYGRKALILFLHLPCFSVVD